ncbi:Ser/Thr protein kinase RdoA (MazF antagonist) [Tenggerimyces flavus]|nr:Ser/Thr protein kinase RdoA (MazF antagonist) [Tenggerimyces flavus]
MAEVVASREADVSPRQLVHGDFWDNNVFFRGERLVAVADFDFLAVRPRLDDLALTLYFADSHLGLDTWRERMTPLRMLVESYDVAQDHPLSAAERLALPWAIGRQPLWGYGHWVVSLPEPAAQRHAAETERDLDRVAALVRDPRWAEAFVTR